MGDAGRGTGGILSMTFGSLFAGIGGIDLGLERAGMECKWQVENDDYATRVLAKHWPDVRRWRDITTFPPDAGCELLERRKPKRTDNRPEQAPWHVDLICGGFPCQDISYAGRGTGLGGERSGLFFEAVRVVRLLKPRYVLLENVAALLTRGLDQVLGTLAAIGFDARWDCIPAAAFGAPHIRDRVFILADASRIGRQQGNQNTRRSGEGSGTQQGTGLRSGDGWWSTEPDVGRVAYGIPARVDRLRGLGNAVVPQVAEWIGRRIIEADKA